MKLWFSRQIFEKDLKWGRTDGLTDMTKLVDSLRKFENAPKKRMEQ